MELNVPLATPLAMVVSGDGWTSALPVPVAASTTVLPRITLPYWSRAVTVIVLALLPVDAVIVAGDATTVVWDALTGPGTVKPVKFTGDPTPVACTTWVLSVGVIRVPSVQLVDAMPLVFEVVIAGFTDPPPSTTDHEICTPATGLLNWSATRTDNAVSSVDPTTPVWRSPPLSVIWVAPATVAVIVKVSGVRPAAPAVVVWVPGVAPRVRIVLACPFTSVCEVVGFTEPPPEAAAQLTVTLGTGLPFASVTSTVCGVLSVVPT